MSTLMVLPLLLDVAWLPLTRISELIRPIGTIVETCRRIISESILAVVGQDVIEAADTLQLCSGLDGGCDCLPIQTTKPFC